MLGYIALEGRGNADQVIRDAAHILQADGLRIAGAVQVNVDHDPRLKCHMDLHILSGDGIIRISQDLGALSKGCRLDPDGLERAVGLVAAALDAGADLLIVNKFGKQELDGRGFRPLIGEALLRGIKVLTSVNPGNLPGFLEFAGDLAHPLPEDKDDIIRWCKSPD